jgi:polysaccharide export outer membrane protein
MIEGAHPMKPMILKRLTLPALLFLIAFAAAPTALAADGGGSEAAVSPAGQPPVKPLGNDPDYLIGPGDILDISVWKDEALTKQVVVLPDGKISFPLIGVIVAQDKTVAALKREIEKLLTPRFVSDLILSLEVKQCNSMLVYVIGRVNSPGRQVLNARVTALQSLAIAGGPNPFAKKNDIKIFRQEGGKTTIHTFRYDDVVEGKNMEDNILLKRGDVMVVP